jgi:hypothetical protein
MATGWVSSLRCPLVCRSILVGTHPALMENSFDGIPRGIEWGELKWKFQFNRGAALKNLDLASATRRPKMEIWAATPRAQRSAEG